MLDLKKKNLLLYFYVKYLVLLESGGWVFIRQFGLKIISGALMQNNISKYRIAVLKKNILKDFRKHSFSNF